MDTEENAAVRREMGERIRAFRLQQNIPASVVASKAGVSRTTLQALETGGDARVSSLLAVLRALGRLDAVDAFLPRPTVSPMQMLERGTTRPRIRARRRRGAVARSAVPGAPVLPPEGVRGMTDGSTDRQEGER
jgi:transcriptional regulator with XRE-family HTH domain